MKEPSIYFEVSKETPNLSSRYQGFTACINKRYILCILSENIIFIRMSFRNREKSEYLASFGVILCPVSQRVQIKFIFTNNVHILFLSCNVEKSKQLQNFTEKEK